MGNAPATDRGNAAACCRNLAADTIGSVTYERITTDPDVMGGMPIIRGLRFPVATVVAMVADGMTTDEILAEHPGLTREDVHECLLYAAETVRERELPLRHTA
jgi:uncharacterized protein (DUF433 family)